MGFFSNLFAGPEKSSVSEIKEQLKAGALIVDVRTEREFAQGNIPKSLNIPLQVINQFVDKIKTFNKPVIVYCRSGIRAGKAKKILTNAGLTVFNAGGLVEFQKIITSGKN